MPDVIIQLSPAAELTTDHSQQTDDREAEHQDFQRK